MRTPAPNGPSPDPWYRHRWPWLLMLGPVTVIIAGIITTWLAVSGADGLVEDDYYKQGLAVNQRKQRDAAALARGLSAEVQQDAAAGLLRLRLSGQPPFPPVLQLQLIHPTRAGGDRTLTLAQVEGGLYQSALAESLTGRWRVEIAGPDADWRLVGDWSPDADPVATFGTRKDG